MIKEMESAIILTNRICFRVYIIEETAAHLCVSNKPIPEEVICIPKEDIKTISTIKVTFRFE